MNDTFSRSLKIGSLLGLLSLGMPSLGAAAQVPNTYNGALEATVNGLISPMIDVLTGTKKDKIALSVAQFRELSTGQRSPLCSRLESDLVKKIRAAMTFKIPDSYQTKKALQSLGGNSADLKDPETLQKFAKLLHVDALVTGEYYVMSTKVIVRVHMIPIAGMSAAWDDSQSFPLSELQAHDQDLIANSQPAGYQATDVPVEVTATVETADVPQGLTDSSALSLSSTAALANLQVRPDTEGDFSWNRVNFGLGYERFYPQNPAFASVTGPLSGAYFMADWADVFQMQFDFWEKPNVQLPDISSLSGFGFSVGLSLPYRLNQHLVFYVGTGGRIESINVGDSNLPSQFAVSFANNSLYVDLGTKLHWGPYGGDLNLSNDYLANETTYFKIKLGFYYELNFN